MLTTAVHPPAAPKRPHLRGDEWGTALVGALHRPWQPDPKIWADNDFGPLGSARGYASLDNAVKAARRLTAGADDGTAVIFAADDRFYLQNTFTQSGDMVDDDWQPFELQANDLKNFRVVSDEVLAVVNGAVAGTLNSPAPTERDV